MIKIDLSPSKKEGGLTNLAGIDLSLINVKMLVLAILILYIPETFLESYYDGEIQAVQQIQNNLNQELKTINQKVGSMSNIQKQVEALREQEEKLARKLEVVKEIINKRQNPYNVLKYIADNIPPDVWLVELSLDDRNLVMKGYSKNWKSIGSFLESLKNSIFFRKDIKYTRPDDMAVNPSGPRLEVFAIEAYVAEF